MKIENHTDWNGRDLRQLVRRVVKNTDGRMHRTVTIRTSKSNRKESKWRVARRDSSCVVDTAANLYRGRASVNSTRYLYMGVPKVTREVDGEQLVHHFEPHQFARVLEHEIAHQRGLRHGDMTDELRYVRQDIRYDLSDIEVKPKPTVLETLPTNPWANE